MLSLGRLLLADTCPSCFPSSVCVPVVLLGLIAEKLVSRADRTLVHLVNNLKRVRSFGNTASEV